ncbi:MAG: hypothetical protein ACP5OC_06675 [Thermoplasmata archaeon]
MDSDYDHGRSRKFVDNLLKHRIKWLFRFVDDPDVESTNNRPEKVPIMGVIYRKVSGGMQPIMF